MKFHHIRYINTIHYTGVGSLKTLYKSWKFCEGIRFIAIHFSQCCLNYMVSLWIANFVAIVKAFIRANLGSSDITIVDNWGMVMLNKVFNRVRLLILIVDGRTTWMGIDFSDSPTLFGDIGRSDSKRALLILAYHYIHCVLSDRITLYDSP
jgi:hypothetical protein